MADNKKKKPVVPARPGTGGKKIDRAGARKVILSSSPERIAQMGTKQIVKLYKTAYPKAFQSGLKAGMKYSAGRGVPVKFTGYNSDGGTIDRREIKPRAKSAASDYAKYSKPRAKSQAKYEASVIGNYRGVQKTKKALQGKSNKGGMRAKAK